MFAQRVFRNKKDECRAGVHNVRWLERRTATAQQVRRIANNWRNPLGGVEREKQPMRVDPFCSDTHLSWCYPSAVEADLHT